MSASTHRKGWQRETIAHVLATSSLGEVLIAQSSRGLCAVLLGDDGTALRAELAARFPRADIKNRDEGLSRWRASVLALVDAPAGPVPDLPLDLSGTAFQLRVWQALRRIPAGETVSYGTFAATIGVPSATRAVARACGANPLAVVVPCHRIVAADGALTGYRWGVERKRALLEREQDAREARGANACGECADSPQRKRGANRRCRP